MKEMVTAQDSLGLLFATTVVCDESEEMSSGIKSRNRVPSELYLIDCELKNNDFVSDTRKGPKNHKLVHRVVQNTRIIILVFQSS